MLIKRISLGADKKKDISPHPPRDVMSLVPENLFPFVTELKVPELKLSFLPY